MNFLHEIILCLQLEKLYHDLAVMLQAGIPILRTFEIAIENTRGRLNPILRQISTALEDGKPARSVELDKVQKELISDLHLITMKQQLYCCNVNEDGLDSDNEYVKSVKALAQKDDSKVVVICGKLESEIADLDSEEEKSEFLEAAGLEESGLDQLISTGYGMLGLNTYFTAGEKEVRAWTFPEGCKAAQAAGIIHTDFERGFIRAESYHCTDLFEYKSELKLKEAGKIRLEGKEYQVSDGDVLHFRFNV